MIRWLRALNEIASIRIWAMFLAGPPWLLVAILFALFVRYGWPAAEASRQLDILGKGLWIVLGVNGVIIVALAAAKVRAQGFGGTGIDIQSGDNDGRPLSPKPAVTTTTTTEVKG